MCGHDVVFILVFLCLRVFISPEYFFHRGEFFAESCEIVCSHAMRHVRQLFTRLRANITVQPKHANGSSSSLSSGHTKCSKIAKLLGNDASHVGARSFFGGPRHAKRPEFASVASILSSTCSSMVVLDHAWHTVSRAAGLQK